jgi:hypothetical protein
MASCSDLWVFIGHCKLGDMADILRIDFSMNWRDSVGPPGPSADGPDSRPRKAHSHIFRLFLVLFQIHSLLATRARCYGSTHTSSADIPSPLFVRLSS